MKTAIEVVKYWYPHAKEIIKNRGNTGYYIIIEGYDYEDTYVVVTKKEIIRHLITYEHFGYNRLLNDRKKKLIALKIMNE
jgi:hypothetical protein